jgi:hypothetical protein
MSTDLEMVDGALAEGRAALADANGERVPERVHGLRLRRYSAPRNTAELGAGGAGGVLVTAIGPRAALLIAGLGPVVASIGGLAALRRPASRGLVPVSEPTERDPVSPAELGHRRP